MKPKGRNKIEIWLITYEDILNIAGLERKIDIKRGTIQKFIKYNRKLNDLVIEKLEEFIKDNLC
ncbi:hypothetical protein [Aquimarina sp. RZ0]|uniref:hypothetical protein n=1 Tax=Aquimarina sp. RZ0 TaxID=2607730 RepID=UPI0011F0A313|nr:hypothetical protein [Aquimarina sp. RZ0]KAA1244500.1 hypothetical protein F0000_16060 [Aquimarina sp. RZ0]